MRALTRLPTGAGRGLGGCGPTVGVPNSDAGILPAKNNDSPGGALP